MNYTHLEPLVDAGAAALKAGLSARIDVVNAASTDFQLAAPKSDAYFVGGSPGPMTTYPAIEISAPEGAMEGPAIQNVELNTLDLLTVAVWAADPSMETLYRSVMRYGRCVLETLVPVAALKPWEIVRIRYRYQFNPETREAQERVAWALIVLTCENREYLT